MYAAACSLVQLTDSHVSVITYAPSYTFFSVLVNGKATISLSCQTCYSVAVIDATILWLVYANA